MRIDWTQTLLGPEGHFGPDDPAAGSARLSARAIALAGRMAGLLGAVLILAGAIAASPLLGRFGAQTDEMLAVVGLLVVQVTAFAIQHQSRSKSEIALPVMCALQVLLVAGLGAGAGLVMAVAALVLAEQVAIAMLLRERRALAAGFFSAGLIAGLAALFLTLTQPFAGALVVGIAIPSLAMLPMLLSRKRAMVTGEAKPSSLAALLDVALSRFPGPVVIVDGIGAIQQPDQEAMFSEHVRSHAIAGPSLTEMLLVVDRPVLLQALSRAIHDQVPSESLVLRMREGAGSRDEGQYRPKRIAIWPVAGLPGRALVLVAEMDGHATEEHPATQAADAALIQRAMHDAVSPFNAGLGYLELIADPRLAPRDLASTRHYAQEAREALIEAHRNTALMGRWLKLVSVPQPTHRERVDLAKIAQDAARIFTSADGDVASIAIEAGPGHLHADISGDLGRFAIGVLLRAALRDGPSVRLSIRSTGADAVITARPAASSDARPAEDMFQMALEQAVQGLAPARFARSGEEHLLVLRGVAVQPLRPLTSGETEPMGRGRLAS